MKTTQKNAKVACQVCHKATATVMVKDCGLKTYPACRECADEMQANARYCGVAFDRRPLETTVCRSCKATDGEHFVWCDGR